MLVDQYLS